MSSMVKEFEKSMQKADRILRPYYFFVNPSTDEEAKNKLSEKGIVVENDAVEVGKVLIANRSVIDGNLEEYEEVKHG